MTRILIEDLPADTDLTTEELEQIHGGAGRPSFRPTLEGLEGRVVLAANVTASVAGGVLKVEGTPGNDNVAIRRVGNQIEVLNVGTRQLVKSIDANQVKALDVLMGGGSDRLDLTGLGALSRDARIEGGKGALDVLYNQAGRQTQEHWQGDRLTSRDATTADGAKVHGGWKDGKWVETSTGTTWFRSQTETYDRPGGKLLSRVMDLTDGRHTVDVLRPDGRWVTTTTNSPAFTQQITVYDKLLEPNVSSMVLARTTYEKDGTITRGALIKGRWIEAITGSYRFQGDGTLRVTTSDGLSAGEYTYQRVADGWKLVSASYRVAGGAGWVEESWGADGIYTKNVWTGRQHGAEGSPEHLYRVVVKGGLMTVTAYHQKGNTLYYGAENATADDATVTWTYALDANNSIKSLLSYKATQTWTREWSATWSAESGWGELYPRTQGGDPRFNSPGYLPDVLKSDPPNVHGETVSGPSGKLREEKWVDGKYVVEVFEVEYSMSAEPTRSVVFIFSGSDMKELLEVRRL